MVDSPEAFEALAERAVSEPSSVSVEELTESLRTSASPAVDDARRAFLSLAESGPDAASRTVDALVRLVSDLDAVDAGAPAARVALANVCMEHPEDAADRAPTALLELASEGEPHVREYAFNALNAVAKTRPAALTPEVLPVLRPYLTDDTVENRGMALAVAAELARRTPADVAPLAPALLEAVTLEQAFRTDHERFRELPDQIQTRLQETETRQLQIRMIAALSLVEIARVDPAAVVDPVHTLLDRLPEESNLTVREATYDLVWLVASDRPDRVTAAVDPLADRLPAEDDPEIQGKIARALAMVADADPGAVVEAVRPALSTLHELLDADDQLARGGATGLLAYVAEVDPDAVEPMTSRLWELTADGPTYVRGNAIWCLAYAGGDDAAERLSEFAETASDPDVRAVASEAANLATEG